MSIDNRFYIDTTASRHELRDLLARADIGLEAKPDFKHLSTAVSNSTDVTINEDLSYRTTRPDNGVRATRRVSFGFRKEDWDKYYTQTVRGIMTLLKAFPEADAYWVALDGEYPMLLRRGGRLVLSQDMAVDRGLWVPARRPSYLALVDLPYTMEPLGRHWNDIPVEPALQSTGP